MEKRGMGSRLAGRLCFALRKAKKEKASSGRGGPLGESAAIAQI